MLAYGTTWVNAMDCRIEDNQVLDVIRPEQTAAGASQSAQTSPAEAAQVPIGETLSLT